jgi:hypothetical protein
MERKNRSAKDMHLAQEAEQLCERAADKFADVKLSSGSGDIERPGWLKCRHASTSRASSTAARSVQGK